MALRRLCNDLEVSYSLSVYYWATISSSYTDTSRLLALLRNQPFYCNMPPVRSEGGGRVKAWWWEHFQEHPDGRSGPGSTYKDGKIKVYCKKCLDRNIREEQAIDAMLARSNPHYAVRTVEEISLSRMLRYAWTISRSSNLFLT